MTTTTYGRETSHIKGSDFAPGIMGRVKGYFARTRAERQLHQLDDRMLADIGRAPFGNRNDGLGRLSLFPSLADSTGH